VWMTRIRPTLKELFAEMTGDGRMFDEARQEKAMAGGSKPLPKSKVKNVSQDGAHKGGGIKTIRHAGPGRASKTKPTGTKGRQLQARAER
jgi:hypothetical protein